MTDAEAEAYIKAVEGKAPISVTRRDPGEQGPVVVHFDDDTTLVVEVEEVDE